MGRKRNYGADDSDEQRKRAQQKNVSLHDVDAS